MTDQNKTTYTYHETHCNRCDKEVGADKNYWHNYIVIGYFCRPCYNDIVKETGSGSSDPTPPAEFDTVPGEGAAQYTFDTAPDQQLALKL